MTFPKANSGIYFHTEYQEGGWPDKGFECQVNQTHGDVKKTGGLYNVKDVLNESPVKDNEWYTYHIIVKGKQVVVKINDKTLFEYAEPPGVTGPTNKLDKGKFAIQAHDPKSQARYKNIMVKPLPD